MKLIALKRISAKLPIGAMFDVPDKQAKPFILGGYAKAADDAEKPARRTYRRRDLRAEA